KHHVFTNRRLEKLSFRKLKDKPDTSAKFIGTAQLLSRFDVKVEYMYTAFRRQQNAVEQLKKGRFSRSRRAGQNDKSPIRNSCTDLLQHREGGSHPFVLIPKTYVFESYRHSSFISSFSSHALPTTIPLSASAIASLLA